MPSLAQAPATEPSNKFSGCVVGLGRHSSPQVSPASVRRRLQSQWHHQREGKLPTVTTIGPRKPCPRRRPFVRDLQVAVRSGLSCV
uniref:Macaca fascicularis brain cDNA clone: QtrA-17005, similar to human protein phosphatase 1, regulatory (inhibitor) subunit13B (PPP1R13B), mRNA, RefSeq: NM_015316.1 n=1 Tax=Macaca fascicularis TaxID=9541 RepID=I7GM18_MACFA|nr:unnamed protein product [Macaca fascicularis]